jgi:hypothetical protein
MSAGTAMESSSDSQRNARYAHLVGRLRSREITMEEATELFTLMQLMLRNSELARVAALRASAGTPGPPVPSAPRTAPAVAAAPASDDLFLVGLLAMGAGAGLMAAMAKRLTGPPPEPEGRRPANAGGPSP